MAVVGAGPVPMDRLWAQREGPELPGRRRPARTGVPSRSPAATLDPLHVSKTAEPVEKLPETFERCASDAEKRHHDHKTWSKSAYLNRLMASTKTRCDFFNRPGRLCDSPANDGIPDTFAIIRPDTMPFNGLGRVQLPDHTGVHGPTMRVNRPTNPAFDDAEFDAFRPPPVTTSNPSGLTRCIGQ